MDISNINKKRINDLLKENKRTDGRDLFEHREIKIDDNVSINAEGSARVKIGKTDVIVGVKMNIQEPYPDHEDEGTMSVSMEFSPMSGDRYESGPPQIGAIEVARIVDRGIRESGFIDWKKLCIKERELVWSISVDIYCINDDGNALDASAIGALTALKTARFPVFDKEKQAISFGEFTSELLPLTEKMPITMTFHKVGDKFIVDPNREEEDSSEARLTIAVSQNKKEKMINAMQKEGMTAFTIDELKEIVLKSSKIYDSIFPKIDKRIKELTKK
jgi:exosome complex component RRP42